MKFTLLFFTLLNGAYAVGFGNTFHAEYREVPDVENMEVVEISEYELFQNTKSRGFPAKVPRAYDPVNNEHYDGVIVGQTYEAGLLDSYDYWRYVTVYNVIQDSERVAYLPYFEEACHDSSFFMAQWGESRSLSVSLSSTIGAEALGLNASVTMSIEAGVTFSTSRRVQATKGLQARHYPYKLSEQWVGVTYIQTYDKDRNSYGYLKRLGGFDRLKDYPHEFEIDNQNVGFAVKREVVKKCENYDPGEDKVESNALYIR
ncbi:MAG: hypothetical protein KC478_02085 [Bacteriovoracaceae bacterium]|nr:hypothetical protein [Bacteriovoracaceae bacterium]